MVKGSGAEVHISGYYEPDENTGFEGSEVDSEEDGLEIDSEEEFKALKEASKKE